MTFQTTMPDLDIDIIDAGDHYNLSAKGYTDNINIPKFSNRFLAADREGRYEFIYDADITPAPEPVVMLRIKKRDFSESRRGRRRVGGTTKRKRNRKKN